MEPALQQLLDRQACEDVLMRYGRTLDWLDGEGHASCFWPDAEIDYGFFTGSGEDWVPVVMDIETASPHRWHALCGSMVQVEGDSAKAESYGIAVGTAQNEDGEQVDTMFGGRYLDELHKRDGQWRIARRRYVADWVHQFPRGVDALKDSGMALNVLRITAAGHAQYRAL